MIQGIYWDSTGLENALAKSYRLPLEAGPELLGAYADVTNGNPGEVVTRWRAKLEFDALSVRTESRKT